MELWADVIPRRQVMHGAGESWELGNRTLNGRERNCLFRGRGDGRFEDAAFVFGVDGAEDGRGAVTADLDGDGAPDLVVANHEQPTRVWRHRETGGRWVRISLRGRAATNGEAIGATVVCRGAGVPTQALPITAGTGFLAQVPAEAWFGLGDASAADITVRWPGGRVTTDTGLTPGWWEIDEAAGTVRRLR